MSTLNWVSPRRRAGLGLTDLRKGWPEEVNPISELITSPAPFTRPHSLEIALAAARAADDNRGRDIQILDVRELTPIFDYFVIATGNSGRQLHALADETEHVLTRDLGQKRLGIEGYQRSSWILLDFGDVIVHFFDSAARDYYALEQLWCKAKRVPFEPAAPPLRTVS